VDNDPIVVARGFALPAEDSPRRTTRWQVVTTDPAVNPAIPRNVVFCPRCVWIDVPEPVGVVLVGVICHLDGDEDPTGTASRCTLMPYRPRSLFPARFCASSPGAVAL
jgi:hypothetical protein